MKRTDIYPLDYFSTILGTFDIGGSSIMNIKGMRAKGLEYDMNRLQKDRNVLEEDYKNVCEKIIIEEKNHE